VGAFGQNRPLGIEVVMIQIAAMLFFLALTPAAHAEDLRFKAEVKNSGIFQLTITNIGRAAEVQSVAINERNTDVCTFVPIVTPPPGPLAELDNQVMKKMLRGTGLSYPPPLESKYLWVGLREAKQDRLDFAKVLLGDAVFIVIGIQACGDEIVKIDINTKQGAYTLQKN
jgi:hypothetical protein